MPPITTFHFTEAELQTRLEEVAGTIHGPGHPLTSLFPEELLRGKGPPKPAGVLVPFVVVDGEWSLLFTRRADTLVEHTGQVAFPGGRMDPGEITPEETAVREAFEEIGLQPENVRLLGRVDTFITNTNYRVTPVIGVAGWPFAAKLQAGEVARVFTIPVRWLAEQGNWEWRERAMPAGYAPLPVIYYHQYDGEVLWGVSAYITVRVMELLFGNR